MSIIECLEYSELKYIEKKLWKSLNGHVTNVNNLMNTIDPTKYRLVINNSAMGITNLNSKTHPVVTEKIKLLFVAAYRNNVPKDVYHCIVTEYLKNLNDMTHRIACNIDDKKRKLLNSYGCRGITGPTGPKGCVGIQGPVGVAGPVGCKGDRGDSGYNW